MRVASVPTYDNLRVVLLGMVNSPLAAESDPSVRYEPHRVESETPTLGWLLDQKARGRLPSDVPELTARQRADVEARLSILQSERKAPPGMPCSNQGTTITRVLPDDGLLRFTSPISVRLRVDGTWSPSLKLHPDNGGTLEAVLPGRELEVRSDDGWTGLVVCGRPAPGATTP